MYSRFRILKRVFPDTADNCLPVWLQYWIMSCCKQNSYWYLELHVVLICSFHNTRSCWFMTEIMYYLFSLFSFFSNILNSLVHFTNIKGLDWYTEKFCVDRMAVSGNWRPLSGLVCEVINWVGMGNLTHVREKSGNSISGNHIDKIILIIMI